MSFHRENVVWKSRNGTWGIGFFQCTRAVWAADSDPEWDVDYDFDRFEWASTGHATYEAARAAWRGANPGGGSVYEEPSAETDQYDEMAKACNSR